jgi:hypothetical protein
MGNLLAEGTESGIYYCFTFNQLLIEPVPVVSVITFNINKSYFKGNGFRCFRN